MSRLGNSTIVFDAAPYVTASAALGGKKEAAGPYGGCFDITLDDDRCGEESWEKAESLMQREVLQKALQKARLALPDMDVMLAGDLLNQCTCSALAARDSGVPFFGVYGACSTMAQTLALSGMLVSGGFARRAAAVTSSHFCTAERQFRTPLEYGGQRTPSAQWTATAAGAVIVSGTGDKGQARLRHAVIGRIEDLGVTDANNMGAAMAPAAAGTLSAFFDDTATSPGDYDLVITGDLGRVGGALLRELMSRRGYALGDNYCDCGVLLYDVKEQDVHAGGSGCGCSASMLAGHFLPQIEKGIYKNIIFAATGALMSTTSSQQGESIPGISHLVHITGGG